MREITDWAGLWWELSQAQRQREHTRTSGQDVWREKAREYQARASHRWIKPDSSREMVVRQLAAKPHATLLDIGAGTGSWTAYLAPSAARITAVDPSPAMLAVLRENLAAQGITNVDIVEDAWPGAPVTEHDFSLCSHAMYSSPDLPAFIRGIEEATRCTCFLVLRAPAMDGVMAEAARHVWGHPFDSPNFQVAYNVLLQMGIRANVAFEEAGNWDAWRSATLADALVEAKRRFLLHTPEHDAFLLDLLERRLSEENGELVWPRDIRSALVYWQSRER